MEYGTHFQERQVVKPPAALRLPGVVSVHHDHRAGTETLTYCDGRKEVRALPGKALVVSPSQVHHTPATSRVLTAQPRSRRQAKAEIEAIERRLDPATLVLCLERRYPESKRVKPTLVWDGIDREGLDRSIRLTAHDHEQLAAQREAKRQAIRAEVISLKSRIRTKDRWIA